MTALERYQRLEAAAMWRETSNTEQREVIVSIGDATLTVSDTSDRALAHWSLAALCRENPGKFPAVYHPEGDAEETLEIGADETEMLEALEILRGAVARRQPRNRTLRGWISGIILLAVVAAVAVWLPGALREHTLQVVPNVKRAEIGQNLLTEVETFTGPPCETSSALPALSRLARRITRPGQVPPTIHVLRSGLATTAHLPGNILLINSKLITNSDDPDIPAGYLLAELERAKKQDPMDSLLKDAGPVAVSRLLTTGDIAEDVLRQHAAQLLAAQPSQLDTSSLISAFDAVGLQPKPYARAISTNGGGATDLRVAADADTHETTPALLDGDWLRLQGICGS